MRAIKGNVENDNNTQDADNEIAEDSIDTLDIQGETEDVAESSVSSKSIIKTMVSGKSFFVIGMVVVVIMMIKSTFFPAKKVQLDADGEVIEDISEKESDIPLSKVHVPKGTPDQVAQKPSDEDNPFKKISQKSADIFGDDDIVFDDPDLPSLELSKDEYYLDPTQSVETDNAYNKNISNGGSNNTHQNDKNIETEKPLSALEQMGIEGRISMPSWVNVFLDEEQINPANPEEKYDPGTRILYRNGKKYLVDLDLDPGANSDKPSMGALMGPGDGDKNIENATLSPPPMSGGIVGSISSDNIQNGVNGQINDERKLSMFVIEGMPPSASGNKNNRNSKDFIIMDDSLISEKKTNSIKGNVKKLSNLETSILGGKIIDAVLETGLNTQVPGNVRAIVSQDVYGETGEKVLIPKGSRLYGTYSSTVNRGQSRVQISWSRIMRPDGIDVTISAQASDQFGRSGIVGDIDNRIGDSIANSILITMTTLGAGLLAQQLGTNQGQSQVVNPNGTFTTTNITPLNYAAQAAIQTATEMVSSLTAGSTTMTPIISLPQGTKIKIVMDQDVRLPPFKKIILP